MTKTSEGAQRDLLEHAEASRRLEKLRKPIEHELEMLSLRMHKIRNTLADMDKRRNELAEKEWNSFILHSKQKRQEKQ